MVMENDKFKIPSKYLKMSSEELENEAEKRYKEFYENKPSAKKKKTVENCSVKFYI